MRIALLGLACMACAPMEPAPAPPATVAPDADAAACQAEGLGALIGRARNEALGAEARRLSGASMLRWIRPGDAVTMDYQTGRLNIHLDGQDRVERFACG